MQRFPRPITAIAVLAVICGLISGPAQACTSLGFEVGNNLNDFKTPQFNEDNMFKRYSVSHV
jgi:hypothetical protein